MCKISKEERIKECSNHLKEEEPEFMTSPQLQQTFQEENSEFYDLEYCLATEYRYFSGAHRSRIENVLGTIGDVAGRRSLDIGCGMAYFTCELRKRGAEVTGIDSSNASISFAKGRFPDLDLRVHSAYDLKSFDVESFDLVTLIDVIEHLSDPQKVVEGIHRVLKPDGRLVLATDLHHGPWSRGWLKRLAVKSQVLSKGGRAYRLIKGVESYRRQFKNYHASHINPLTHEDLERLLALKNFSLLEHRVYPLVGVPVRDLFLRFLPRKYRGDHQCVLAQKL